MADFSKFHKHYDPTAPELKEALYEVLADMREKCPVARSDQFGGFWFLTRYADVLRVLMDPQTFSSAAGAAFPQSQGQVRLPPLDLDPPEQQAWRKLLLPYFAPAPTAALEPGIRTTATELIDQFIDRGECEFVGDFAQPYPAIVVFGTFLGVERSALHSVLDWAQTISVRPGTPAAADAHRRVHDWALTLMEERRNAPKRGDLMDGLLEAEKQGLFPTDQLVAALMLVIFGGLDTTKVALSNIMRRLSEQPALQERLAADPTIIPAAVEEFLRFEAPATGLSRVATRDVEIGGRSITAGERIVMSWSSANRDAAVFDLPNEIKFDRAPNRHLAFGSGVHLCIGASLARLEIRVALEALAQHLDTIRIASGTDIEYDIGFQRTMKRLPIRFKRRSRP